MTTVSNSTLSTGTAAMVSLWINRGLEALWLLTVFLTPLAFLDQTYAISEASIGYVEVPKIALLRTLAGLMAALWLIEWGIQGRLPFEGLLGSPGQNFQPRQWFPRLRGWLRDRPTRWLLLAVWFFLGTTLLSTALSGSRGVSLWGEVPGQDGYPAYTVVAYVLLFSVVATHLRTKVQLWRLIAAIVAMGTLVAVYAIFQHYGHDFLDLIEETGGGASEVSVFMGNSLFAGATLMMVVPITLAAAVLSVRESQGALGWSWSRLRPFLLSLAVVGLWSAILTVQLLGITFTFARGPWVGMVAAMVGFIGLAALFAGWRPFARVAMILGLTVAWGVAVLHGLGSISILGFGPWFGLIIALIGFLAVALVHMNWRVLGRMVLGVGLAVTLAVVIVLALSWFRSDDPSAAESSAPDAGAASTAGEVVEQLSSIRGEVLSGFASGRATHWKVSWKLFRDHPWFEFDSLSLPWLRPLIGYGPDLFRYTYLLESPPEGNDLLPSEPDHAHNFFIHHAVVQGIFGLLSSLGIFAVVFIVGIYLLLRERQNYSMAHKLLLVGLVATLAGRFLEMMVGVARVSDLTVFWVLLALFAAVPQAIQDPATVPEAVPPQPTRRRARRRVEAPSSQVPRFNWTFIGRFAVVSWLIAAIFVLTWVKSVNNVRAAVEVGVAAASTGQGDFQAGLAHMDRAIELAPDISSYYNYKSEVFSAYQRSNIVTPELNCSTRENQGYRECLALQSYFSNLEGVQRRPFYYRSHFALANSAFTLGSAGATITIAGTKVGNSNSIVLADEAVRLYQETLALVPGSWRLRNELADAYLSTGQPEAALKALEQSLAITGEDRNLPRFFLLQGKAYQQLGDFNKAAQSLERYLQLSGKATLDIDEVLAEAYISLGQWDLAAAEFFRLGIAYQDSGQFYTSIQPLTRSADAYEQLGQKEPAAEAWFRLGLAWLSEENLEQSAQAFERNLALLPQGPSAQDIHGLLAEVYSSLGRTELAATHRALAQP